MHRNQVQQLLEKLSQLQLRNQQKQKLQKQTKFQQTKRRDDPEFTWEMAGDLRINPEQSDPGPTDGDE